MYMILRASVIVVSIQDVKILLLDDLFYTGLSVSIFWKLQQDHVDRFEVHTPTSFTVPYQRPSAQLMTPSHRGACIVNVTFSAD